MPKTSRRPTRVARLSLLTCCLAAAAALPAAAAEGPAQTTGSISGTVTDASTGLGIHRCMVIAFRADTHGMAGFAPCSPTGSYQLSSLSPRSYFVYVQSQETDPSYLDEYYDDQIVWSLTGPWSTWPVTPVAVVAGQDTGGVDFELDRGGSISGSVAASGSGPAVDFSLVRVEVVHTVTGAWKQYAVDLQDGTYRAYGLETGDYAVFTKGGARLVNEVFDDHPCEAFVDCDPASTGDPVHAVRTLETPGIGFVLDRGGWVSGTVRDGFTGEPLPATVDVLHPDGTVAARTRRTTGADWVTWEDHGLAAGSYVVRASTGMDGVWLYGDVHCPECDPGCDQSCPFPPSTPVPVVLGEETSGIVIHILPAGGIFGDGFESGGLDRWSTSTP